MLEPSKSKITEQEMPKSGDARSKPLIVGNWKMNGTIPMALPLLHGLMNRLKNSELPSIGTAADIVVCPPYPLLYLAADTLGHGGVKLGAQDCHTESQGAFTGGVSAIQLADVGCEYVILGHSERRQMNNETNETIARKVTAAHAAGLIAIVCVGESEQEYTAGKRTEPVLQQLHHSLPMACHSRNTVIAYEPIWAIGTGRTPTGDEINEMHAAIRQSLGHNGLTARIIYGGSVKAANAAEILALAQVDGVLPGGASLLLDEFWGIITAAVARPARASA